MNPMVRTITSEARVQKTLDSSRKEFKRIDGVFKSLCWRLAREPEAGVSLSKQGPLTYLIKLDPDPDPELQIPGISAVYEYDNKKVIIIEVKIYSPPSAKKKKEK
jgi:hypothetical protein